eukprot:15232128-Heterocapsa_arctica.AAC.1
MKKSSIKPNGSRVQADFRRVGRPRHKWYDCVRQLAIQSLIKQHVITEYWHFVMRDDGLTSQIFEAAKERLF